MEHQDIGLPAMVPISALSKNPSDAAITLAAESSVGSLLPKHRIVYNKNARNKAERTPLMVPFVDANKMMME